MLGERRRLPWQYLRKESQRYRQGSDRQWPGNDRKAVKQQGQTCARTARKIAITRPSWQDCMEKTDRTGEINVMKKLHPPRKVHSIIKIHQIWHGTTLTQNNISYVLSSTIIKHYIPNGNNLPNSDDGRSIHPLVPFPPQQESSVS